MVDADLKLLQDARGGMASVDGPGPVKHTQNSTPQLGNL